MHRLQRYEVKYLKGVGPKRAALLEKELGIKSVLDLLQHYPSSYLDRSRIHRIAELSDTMGMVQVKGRFIGLNTIGEGARRRLVGLFCDGYSSMDVVWFRGIERIQKAVQCNVEYVLFGKPGSFNGTKQMAHPEIDLPQSLENAGVFRGVYPLTEKLRQAGFTSKTFHTLAMEALKLADSGLADPMPAEVLAMTGLPVMAEALAEVHNPQSSVSLARARERLKFDELFYLELDILRHARTRSATVAGHRFTKVGEYFNRFYREQMPFELTNAQKRVIREIWADMSTGRQMNRLLQGDVGSGKTLVALLTMLIALDNGMQSCIMAPTEILATQHYESIRGMAAPLGISVGLLTGSTPASVRRELHAGLLDGTLHILVGTHAVIEDNVKFARLGYVVIDEQHRFGVAQRARLWSKGAVPPHVLVMTATPIPRTLAMTVYGDLEVSVIDELPPGRKPVHTSLRFDDDREAVYRFIGSEIKAGRQAYIVYPLVKENEKLDLKSLEEGYRAVCDTFPHRRVAYVHGRMKPAEKEWQMRLFATGEAEILVSTTVIEVGVNVPNASVMVIENAERFGLSQLHQLRGRVGRGADKSYCILMSRRNLGKDTRQRLELMTQTTDGFVIAEADMKMRGPGDIEGTMQSGIPFDLKIANLATDGRILSAARTAAQSLLDADPTLASHPATVAHMSAIAKRPGVGWSRIS